MLTIVHNPRLVLGIYLRRCVGELSWNSWNVLVTVGETRVCYNSMEVTKYTQFHLLKIIKQILVHNFFSSTAIADITVE